MTLILSSLEPFAQGGNRLCFIHPSDKNKVIKVRRPDFSLEEKRRRKGGLKRLRPLSSFDDNLDEYKVMQSIDKSLGDKAYDCISRCYGFEDTDLGAGLVSDLVRDEDGHVSHTLKQYIWDNGYTETCQKAVEKFTEDWVILRIPSTDLLLHNIVVQLDSQANIKCLMVVDGLGESKLIPNWLTPEFILNKKFRRRIKKLEDRISQLLEERGGDFPGYHGRLLKDSRNEN